MGLKLQIKEEVEEQFSKFRKITYPETYLQRNGYSEQMYVEAHICAEGVLNIAVKRADFKKRSHRYPLAVHKSAPLHIGIADRCVQRERKSVKLLGI